MPVMVPNRIKELRAQRGLSQEGLARECHTTHATIGKLEKGDMELTLNWMRRIAGALDCKPVDLLSDDDLAYKLGPEEMSVLEIFNRLNGAGKRRFLKVAEALAEPVAGDEAA